MRKLKIFLIYVTVFILVLQTSLIIGFLRPEKARAASVGNFYPTAGIDKTSGTYNLTSSDLNKLVATDGQYYDSGGNWPKNTSSFNESEYIEFVFSPALAGGAVVNSVNLTQVYKNTTANFLTAAKVKVYTGSTFIGEIAISAPSSDEPEVTSTVDLKTDFSIDTAAEVNSLKVRFLAYVSGNNNIKSKHDLVRLTVNSNQSPTAPVLSLPVDGALTNNSTPLFEWSASTDPDGDVVTYTLQVDNNADFSLPEVDADYFSPTFYSPISDLADGTYYWRARSRDDSSPPAYSSWSDVWSLTIDTDAISSVINFPASDTAYNSTSWQNIAGIASDNSGSGVQKVEVAIYDQTADLWWQEGDSWISSATAIWNEASDTESWTLAFPNENLTDGHIYNVLSQATDNADNTQESVTEVANVLYDITLPVETLILNSGAVYTTSPTVSTTITNNADVTGWLLSETQSTPPTDPTWQLSQPATFVLSAGDGEKIVYLWLKDAAGNLNVEIISDSIFLDTTSVSNVGTIISSPDGQTLKEGAGFILSGVTEPYATVTITIFSDPIVKTVLADNSGFWSLIFDPSVEIISAGEHTIQIVITDKAGNKSGAFKIATFTIIAPTVITTAAAVPAAPASPVVARQPAQITAVPSTTVAPTPQPESKIESSTPQPPSEEGKIKAEETTATRDWNRVWVTIALIIIAIGALTAGYYSYKWWTKGKKPPTPPSVPPTTRW